MAKVVSVRQFYQSGCKSPIDELVRDKNRYTVLSSCIKLMCESLSMGLTHQEILNAVRTELESSYEDSFFSFSWQRETAISDDMAAFERFLSWFGTTKVLSGRKELVAHVTENTTLTSHVDMIAENPDGTVSAFIIHSGKSSKSMNGKSAHTAAQTDLYAMCAKLCLEAEYPDCSIVLCYLHNSEDSSGHIGSIKCDGTKKSNLFVLKYLSYYNDGYFDRDCFSQAMLRVMNTPVPAPCYECTRKQLCRLSRIGSSEAEVREEAMAKPYEMPEFTPVQEQVVVHKEGPLLVCAGPGSGKTATIVGRIKRLIDDGVPPVLILAITFTNKAAEELKNRCLSFCEEDYMPTIQTLNAFGYSILRKNEELVGKLKVLTQMERYKILSALMENRRIDGQVASIDRKIRQFAEAKDKAAFLKKENLSESFVELYGSFSALLLEQGYISFDEQITRCLDLFQEHPEVVEVLQHRYPYIMVDEYQDIDADQAAFIYQIAAHGNIVAVGDDDQSIYGFRGGSNRFMLEFPKHFKGAKTVVLSDNFRSSKSIVEAAQKVIDRNSARIPKQLHAAKAEGVSPQALSGGIKELNELVSQLLSQGYHYGDIAILASKNATLEEYGGAVDFPHILEKTYLIEDAFFTMIRCTLELVLKGATDKSFVSLAYAMHVPLTPVFGRSQYEAVCEVYGDVLSGQYVEQSPDIPITELLHTLCLARKLAGKRNAVFFVESMAELMGMTNVLSYEHLVKLAAYKSLPEFLETLEYMVEFSDDTRLETLHENAAVFITSHDAKGKEFPVVILLDDFLMETEEDTRLYYVALTRAMEQLYVLKKPGQTTLLEAVV